MNKLTRMALGGGVLAYRALRRRTTWSFHNRVVLLTGGSRGLGLVIARQLVDEGAKLTLLARDAAELGRAEQELRGRGGEILAIAGDVRVREDAARAVEQTVARFGQIDVLINDAGVIQTGPIEHMAVEDFDEALAVHLYGPLYTMLAATPHMKRQGGGRIVNISSIGGKISVPHLVPYCTSKFALVGLSDGMRAELAKDKIKVTTVCPGLMRTGSHYNSKFKGQHEREFTWFSIIDSLPISSISAERAAGQIIEACRNGDAELVISMQAKELARLAPLLPEVTAAAMALFNRLLPNPATDPAGDEQREGWDSTSSLAPSILTRLSDEATVENNGLKGHAPPV